ncbi:MAG: MaoC/PaaZ C-terminal domain-containing protein [Thermaerobacter sp.]|nr:MaoC/PaaZ C-terminal domain-containing protein [Thermaerobacter sp.]
MASTTRFYEDFSIGDRFHSGGRTVTEAEIITFAHHFDPQAMHLDAQSAAQGPFQGLIASGFHTMGIAWWLFLRLGLVTDSMFVGLGVNELRWLKPVRPGDTLSLDVVVAEKSPPKNGRGAITFAHSLQNQTDLTVMTYQSVNLILQQPR